MLEYTYIFDPNEAWSSFSQFDEAMGKMLESIGLEAQNVRCMGDEKKKVIEIVKKQEVAVPQQATSSIKQQKYNLTRKQGFNGKFVKIT